jgi:hypothetical protein
MYDYKEQKRSLFTESGTKMLLAVRDSVDQKLKLSGAVRSGEAISNVTGNSWTMLACLDYLVETGEIREITGSNAAGQDRVFVRRQGEQQ